MVERLWPGSTVVCIASGPSLTVEDVNAVRGKARVIAVNDAIRIVPWADALYSSDVRFWSRMRGVPSFTGLKFSIEKERGCGRKLFEAWPEIVVLRNAGHDGLSLFPDGLMTGHNSGAAAINLAVLFGAIRVLLLGYDCEPALNGTHHFCAEATTLVSYPYDRYKAGFQEMVAPLRKAGVAVWNCSRRTALDAFPRMPLAEALALPAVQQAVAS